MNDGVNCRYLKELCMLALPYKIPHSVMHYGRLHIAHCVANTLSVCNTVADVLS